MDRVLVSGASGYLGSKIVLLLLDNGFKVSIVQRKSSKLQRKISDRVDDILLFDNLSHPLSSENRFSVIVNCMALYKSTDPWDLVKSNIYLPLELINSYLDHGGFFINVDTALNKTLNKYSFSKKHFSEILTEFKSHSFKAINLSLEYFFDESEPKGRFIKNLITKCFKNEDIDLTKGEQVRDFIFMDDVLSAVLIILQNMSKLESGEIPIGSGIGISIKDLAKKIHSLTGSKSQLNFGAISYRENEQFSSVADISKMHALSWEPKFSLEDALKKTIKALKNG